ncbi:MAG: DNA primase family protein, partial [Chloroflexota bacterium]
MAPPDGETGETHDQATSSGAATSPPGNSTSTAKSAQGPAYVVVDRRDFAHAELLAHLLNNQVRWCPEEKTWRVYRQGYWAAESEEAVAKMASDSLQACYGQEIAKATSKADIETLVRKITDVCIHGRIMGILGFLKGWPNVATHQNEWDRDGWLLNLKNGTADLRTIKMRSHKPEDLLTKIAPVRFDPEATAPAWEQHLDRFLPDGNIRRQVKRDLGKALVGATLDETLAIWHGSGGNGKTTTIRVLMGILGDYAIKPMQGLLVQYRWDPHPTILADLAKRRVVFATETERGQKLSEALVKDLSGGDVLRARRMYQDSFEFPRTFSIFLATNNRPVVSGRDRGIWRRLRLVPWEQEIDERDRRPQDEVVN